MKLITYNLADFLGDIGGVFEVFLFIFGLIFMPLNYQSFVLRALKSLYKVRTSNVSLLPKANIQRPDPESGKVVKNVRFQFQQNDKNHQQQIDREDKVKFELEMRKPVVIAPQERTWFFCQKMFGCTPFCTCDKNTKRSRERKRLLYHKLISKGEEKLKEDFDAARLIKHVNDMRSMLTYYKARHSNVQIEINKSRKAVINLEDDGWESEFDRTEVYLTKFEKHITTSSEEEEDTDSLSSSTSKNKSKSVSKASK